VRKSRNINLVDAACKRVPFFVIVLKYFQRKPFLNKKICIYFSKMQIKARQKIFAERFCHKWIEICANIFLQPFFIFLCLFLIFAKCSCPDPQKTKGEKNCWLIREREKMRLLGSVSEFAHESIKWAAAYSLMNLQEENASIFCSYFYSGHLLFKRLRARERTITPLLDLL